MAGEGHGGELGGGDLDAGRVVALITFGVDFEPGAGRGPGDEVHDDFVALERSASPVAGDGGEEPVFDLFHFDVPGGK